MSIVISIGPAEEPVTIDDVKSHCNIYHDDDDILIEGWIKTAREQIEIITKRSLISQTIEERFDYVFPTCFYLQRNPVISITSIKYVDESGIQQTLDPSIYVLDNNSEVARVYPDYGESWPSTRCQWNAVTITYTAGYGTAQGSVPKSLIHAILLLCSHYDLNREIAAPVKLYEIPNGIFNLISSFIVDR